MKAAKARTRSGALIFGSNVGLLALGAAFLVLPCVLAELYLFQKFSSLDAQMGSVRREIELGRSKRLAWLGDSTIRNLGSQDPNSEAGGDAVNLAAGGMLSMEWYYSLRNATKEVPGIRRVAVGMANGEALISELAVYPYYPFLLSLGDIWSEYYSGVFTLEQSLRLLISTHFKFPLSSNETIELAFREYHPPLALLLSELKMQEMEKKNFFKIRLPRRASAAMRLRGLNKLLAFGEEHGMHFVFMLSPASSTLRANVGYLQKLNLFFEICRVKKLKCQDFSSKIEDRYFAPDGVHLMGKGIEQYRALIGAYLLADLNNRDSVSEENP